MNAPIRKPAVAVRRECGDHIRLTGRQRELLAKLLAAGSRGVSAFDFPTGCRVSSYVHRLRQQGFPIETEMVGHDGDYPGQHAVYRLAPGARIIAEGA